MERAARKTIRQHGIPPEADLPVSSYRDARTIQAHLDYEAAKGGHREAAARFVSDMVKPETVEETRRRFGPDVLYVPVHAEEESGRNQIPVFLDLRVIGRGALASWP